MLLLSTSFLSIPQLSVKNLLFSVNSALALDNRTKMHYNRNTLIQSLRG
jgi:hypothetical protein